MLRETVWEGAYMGEKVKLRMVKGSHTFHRAGRSSVGHANSQSLCTGTEGVRCALRTFPILAVAYQTVHGVVACRVGGVGFS